MLAALDYSRAKEKHYTKKRKNTLHPRNLHLVTGPLQTTDFQKRHKQYIH